MNTDRTLPGCIAGCGERRHARSTIGGSGERRRRASAVAATSADSAGNGAAGSHRQDRRASTGYPGGKAGAGVYQRIINLMPPHEVYIEPFLGGGAVMRMKRPAGLNIGVDLNERAIARAAGLAGGGEGRSRIAGDGDPGPKFRFEVGDGIAFLREYPFTGAELVYCDPPYILSTRSSGRRLYQFEMEDEQHRALLKIVKRLPCRVMVSGYYSQLYAAMLQDWHSIQFQATTRGGTATEWLWFNFAPPVALHDYRYLGRDFRERERISRKKQRWVGRMLRMPALERQSLLAAICDIGIGGDATRSLIQGAGA